MSNQEKMIQAKERLYRAAYLASIGENDAKKIQNAYRLVCDAIDLITEVQKDEAA